VTDHVFITGKLAAGALKKALAAMNPDFEYEIRVLNCSVAALMKTQWIADHMDRVAAGRVVIPGRCQGKLSLIEEKAGVPVVRGPNDLKDLAGFLGKKKVMDGYGDHTLKIIGEIVDAHLMNWDQILATAEYYRACGADIIDIGCPVQGGFPKAGEVIRKLKAKGFTVSLDTFDPETILQGDRAGMDLLLSINSQNMDLADKLKCKVVVIPDFGQGLDSLEKNAVCLDQMGVPYIMDPILDPLNFGFTRSVTRFQETRQRHPNAEMMMGLGNLTELTDADSTGINTLMAGVCSELDIGYVLTTEVISWARGAVRELDLARKLMHYAKENDILPKSIDDRLITIKDPPFESYTENELRGMQTLVQDKNYRIFTDHEFIYMFNGRQFIKSCAPQEILDQLDLKDPSHAFYLGRELERAALSVQLGKRYVQDTPLRWGYHNTIKAGGHGTGYRN